MLPQKNKQTIGDCEASHFDGKGVNVPLTLMRGNILLCAECAQKELDAENSAYKAVLQIRKNDTLVEMKQDVFIAGVAPFVEIQAAIMHDDSIPADKKWNAIVEDADKLYQTLTAAIFAEEAALLEKRNARHALHVNIQQAVAKLKETERAKYSNYNVEYKPIKPAKPAKADKPVKPATKADEYNKNELFAACKKYGVESARVRFLMKNRNISAENAAKLLHDMLNG